jgi:hypothetical protein
LNIKSKINTLISPSLKTELKGRLLQISNFVKGLYFWRWKYQLFITKSPSISVRYIGQHAAQVTALLGVDSTQQSEAMVESELWLTDFPLPRAYPIPATLTTIVPLHRTVEEIMATYASSLRRSINKQRPSYRYERIDDAVKVAEMNQTMLMPYANARHENAYHMSLSEITQLALSEHGCLYALYFGDELVGCHLANYYERKGKRYWHVNRFGYIEAVFSDFKRWGEVNSINLHMALEEAIKGSFDYCDYGMSLAKPGSGLIEWKRRRKGFVALEHEGGTKFYLTLPKQGLAQFFWDSPLFSIEKGKVTLHLGIPEGKTDEEILAKYHEMGYMGLYKVYLNCLSDPSDAVVEGIRALYQEEQNPPMIITYGVQ